MEPEKRTDEKGLTVVWKDGHQFEDGLQFEHVFGFSLQSAIC